MTRQANLAKRANGCMRTRLRTCDNNARWIEDEVVTGAKKMGTNPVHLLENLSLSLTDMYWGVNQQSPNCTIYRSFRTKETTIFDKKNAVSFFFTLFTVFSPLFSEIAFFYYKAICGARVDSKYK